MRRGWQNVSSLLSRNVKSCSILPGFTVRCALAAASRELRPAVQSNELWVMCDPQHVRRQEVAARVAAAAAHPTKRRQPRAGGTTAAGTLLTPVGGAVADGGSRAEGQRVIKRRKAQLHARGREAGDEEWWGPLGAAGSGFGVTSGPVGQPGGPGGGGGTVPPAAAAAARDDGCATSAAGVGGGITSQAQLGGWTRLYYTRTGPRGQHAALRAALQSAATSAPWLPPQLAVAFTRGGSAGA